MMDSGKVLLVEGPDDKAVVDALIRGSAIDPSNSIEVRAKDGYETLRRSLRTEVVASGLSHIGIVVDADASAPDRWRSLADALRPRLAQPLPANPGSAKGWIGATEKGVRLGIWLMPDNLRPGMLEDFLLALEPDGWLQAEARDAIARLPAQEPRFRDAHLSKAVLHTWLAWRDPPGRPIRQAALQRWFDPARPACTGFLEWVGSTFDLARSPG